MSDIYDPENKEILKKLLEQMRNQNQDDDDDTPLTKPKKQTKKQEIVVEQPKKSAEEVKKPRKKMPPKTQKQLEQFKTVMEKRKETVEKNKSTHRSITIDGKELEFTEGFSDLHTKIYEDIINGNGFGIENARASIEAAFDIRHLPVTKVNELFHPILL